MYKTGIETKQNIIDCSKKLFHEQGYKQTSVNAICQASDTKLGTFTYYFPKKQDLLSELYPDYMQRCVDYVDAHTEGLSLARRHMYVVMLYYGNLYSDLRTVSFHQEVLQIASMNVWFHNTRVLISDYSGSNAQGMDDDIYDLCVEADNAVRRELNLEFIERGDFRPLAVKELMHRIYTINARLFGIDQKLMENDLDAAYEFLQKNRRAKISLL